MKDHRCQIKPFEIRTLRVSHSRNLQDRVKQVKRESRVATENLGAGFFNFIDSLLLMVP
jgi:hypothetical protein